MSGARLKARASPPYGTEGHPRFPSVTSFPPSRFGRRVRNGANGCRPGGPASGTRMKLGFIGLGVMGRPMALNLLKQGTSWLFTRAAPEAARALVAMGARDCATPAEVASASEVIFTMVTTSSDVEQVVLGADGVIEGAATGPRARRHGDDRARCGPQSRATPEREGRRHARRARLRRPCRRGAGEPFDHGRRRGACLRTGEAAVCMSGEDDRSYRCGRAPAR